MTTQSDTPRTDATLRYEDSYGQDQSYKLLPGWQIEPLTSLARQLERELRTMSELHTDALIERNALREALKIALPMLDTWLNGDGTDIDMNEWDAATTIARAALTVQS